MAKKVTLDGREWERELADAVKRGKELDKQKSKKESGKKKVKRKK